MIKPYDISLCMVVKNEEECIQKCLSSVKGEVKEIIIVDTGSTDKTKELAEAMGAKVIDHKWNGDFSEARNIGLRKAKCPWILVLDADEEWEHPDEKLIQQLLENDAVKGYHIKLLNYYGGKATDGDFVIDSVCRLFRNDPNIHFQGFIHEEVTKSIKEHYSEHQILFSNLRIHHYGYLDEIIAQKQKNKRNMELVKKAIENSPDDLYMQYALGTEYFQIENFEKALTIYEPILNRINVTAGYASDLLYKIVYCLKELKQYDKALDFIKQGKSFYPDFVDLLELEGLLLFELHRYQEARDVLERCLKIGDVSHRYSTSSGAGTFRTNYLLGLVKERQAEWQQALDHYLQVITIEENFSVALSRWANLSFYFFEDDNEWLQYFQKHFTKITSETCMIIMLQAVYWVRPKIGLLLLNKIQLKYWYVDLLKAIFEAQQGNFIEAKDIITEILSIHKSEQVDLYYWAIQEQLGNKVKSEQVLAELIQKSPDYKGLHEIFVKNMTNVYVKEKARIQCVHILLALQAWEQLVILLVNTKKNDSAFLPCHHFPAFQQAPNSSLKKLLEKTDRILRDWTYTDLIFLGWAALKVNNVTMSYHIFKRAGKHTTKRIEHTIGGLLCLKENSNQSICVHLHPKCLLLTF